MLRVTIRDEVTSMKLHVGFLMIEEFRSATSWSQAISALDDYASLRKEDLDTRYLEKDMSLLKGYMLETRRDGLTSLQDTSLIIDQLGLRGDQIDDRAYRMIGGDRGFVGFAEILHDRYIMLYTPRKSSEMDRLVKTNVYDSSLLDFVWLSGAYLEVIWEEYIRTSMPERYVAFKFEHTSQFETFVAFGEYLEDDEESEVDEIDDRTRLVSERRKSSLSVTSTVRKVAQFLPSLQNVLPDFRAIKMLRFPAVNQRGGYDFWDFGKVTYRSNSFVAGRDNQTQVVRDYWKATVKIEDTLWYSVENTTLPGGGASFEIRGAPAIFRFSQELEQTTFERFIDQTFVRSQGPFRLWGEPIQTSHRKVLIYGVDMHLWQELYMELTPKRFLIVLPQTTCGNTIHRLTALIQRYLDPAVEVEIAGESYRNIMLESLGGVSR